MVLERIGYKVELAGDGVEAVLKLGLVDGERIVLSSRLPKGWTARVERTLTSAEFPGTAVLWDEQSFEVIGAEALPQGVRYTLEPWREHHAMRFTARYDAAAEAALAA